MWRGWCLGALLAMALGDAALAAPRDRIEIVTTAASYGYAEAIAGSFAIHERFAGPQAEAAPDAIGRFCAGVGLAYPDIVISEQSMSAEDRRACRAAGVTPIEISIGYSGLVFVRRASAPALPLTTRDLFLAIAGTVPLGPDEQLLSNALSNWKDVNPKLPKLPIVIYGPPKGTAAAHDVGDLALANGARSFPSLKALEKRDPAGFAALVGTPRGGDAYRPRPSVKTAEELLSENPNALVIENLAAAEDKSLTPLPINGVRPDAAALASGSYGLAHPVKLIVKREHVGIVPGLSELVSEALSDRASGPRGYLRPLGLVPVSRTGAGALVARTR